MHGTYTAHVLPRHKTHGTARSYTAVHGSATASSVCPTWSVHGLSGDSDCCLFLSSTMHNPLQEAPSEASGVIAVLSSPPRKHHKLDVSSLRALPGSDLWAFDMRVKLGIFRFKFMVPVVRLNKDTIVKHGDANHVRLTDARTLDSIARNTSIPVPRVHNVFSAHNKAWVVMDYIDPPLLCHVWYQLTNEEQLSSMHQLKGYIDQLRALQPPEPGKVQAVDGGTCIELRLSSKPWGPFDTIADFQRSYGYDHVREKYLQFRDSFDKVKGRVYRTVFTHEDLGPHNILWKDGKIVAIIDCETAGWLPEYWEYTMCKFGGPELPTWWALYEQVMDRYRDELTVETDISSIFLPCVELWKFRVL
ncbi:hypothetical protein D9615_009901 [Tricholomella constricta]|uniref:Aminoglycoside phosphotransferase domain-containing protein n=1 Tax=Tricholomella constricta TaxID=117010 RepID=A0A8H5GZR2_9AGAR|nr:hypothetical protein D9615_009901 [Tricholomella constricta]